MQKEANIWGIEGVIQPSNKLRRSKKKSPISKIVGFGIVQGPLIVIQVEKVKEAITYFKYYSV
jgi:hypothetical protein